MWHQTLQACAAQLATRVVLTLCWLRCIVTRRTGQALVGQRVSAAQATRRPFYCENDERGPPEYEADLDEQHAQLRERATAAGRTPWHSGGVYDEDGACARQCSAQLVADRRLYGVQSVQRSTIPLELILRRVWVAARQPMAREPEPEPLMPERGSGRKHAPGADNRGRPPWEEARDTELHVDRGKAAPRGRKHRVGPEAGRLMENDHLEAEQLQHQRQVMRSKFADNDRHALEQEKRRANRASMLREKAGGLRRAAAQREDQGVVARENTDLAPRKGRAAPVEAKSRWAEPRRSGGNRKVLAEKGVKYRQLQGVVFPPTAEAEQQRAGVPTPAPQLPRANLQLERVHGYSGADSWGNLLVNKYAELIYYTATVVVVQPPQHDDSGQLGGQRFFFGHDNDVCALAMHPDGETVVSGQIGRDAKVIVWSSRTNEIIVRIPQYHEQRIYALAFSASGLALMSVGAEGSSGGAAEGARTRMVRWDWRTGTIEATGPGPAEMLTGLMFNGHSDDPNAMITYGLSKPPRFWSIDADKQFVKVEGIVKGVGEAQDCPCGTVLSDGSVITGMASGEVYQWKGNLLSSVLRRVHSGAVTALVTIPEAYFASAGQDGLVRWWRLREDAVMPERAASPTGSTATAAGNTPADVAGGLADSQLPIDQMEIIDELALSSVLPLRTHARALAYCKGASTLAIGTTTSDVLLLGLEPATFMRTGVQVVVQGHHGPLRGVATHPTLPYYATAADDNTVRLWSAEPHQCLAGKTLRAAAHHLDFSPDGNSIAAGLKSGGVLVLAARRAVRIRPDTCCDAISRLHSRLAAAHRRRYCCENHLVPFIGSMTQTCDVAGSRPDDREAWPRRSSDRFALRSERRFAGGWPPR